MPIGTRPHGPAARAAAGPAPVAMRRAAGATLTRQVMEVRGWTAAPAAVAQPLRRKETDTVAASGCNLPTVSDLHVAYQDNR